MSDSYFIVPVDPEHNRGAMLAACDQATGGLHAPGFWASAEHQAERWEMCTQLLKRRVQGLAVFAEHILLLLMAPVLLRVCWRYLLPWSSVSPVLTLLVNWTPVLAAVVAAATLEQLVLLFAEQLPPPPLVAAVAGSTAIVLAARTAMAIAVPGDK